MKMKKRILLVEDNEYYAKNLQKELEDKGFEVTYIASPVDAVAQYVKEPYDIVVSDYRMKEMDGIKMFSILKGINPAVKSIILTAFPEEDIEIQALEVNVDQYLSKDKSFHVTIKYIEDLLNKEIIQKGDSGYKLISKEDNLIIDTGKRQVYKNDVPVEVTKKEYELLVLFLENRGIALSREMIADKLWTKEIEKVELRVIDGHIKRLRAKLGIYSISSVRGYGYKWKGL
ncbi:response regulator transcription factor [Ohessyouella blattaphilus]|uniref:Stage 0 sporulation protein A homolog n=1 Tax=Ohessyouella blattaphilus TaxID=2949333 RepID=A0ABT1EDS2_9FIRM|nr:response regulator transcription factor [Ohessyouella blattaphilus]MCP1108862.1 response regulator transcription factor [Ohessyouella blattaphilus]MCR8562256.1 response regulator transcription factor [Ohessyouella blattaphilus]MDL2249087.1 response regulator transcription factor [Lachnospiraceae bacterium OttesenSCG-928-J05]